MDLKVNTPKDDLISKIGDKFKKATVGAVLLGTLTACDINGSADNHDYKTDLGLEIEQNDDYLFEENEVLGSEEVKYREDRNDNLKPEHETDKVFTDYDYLNEEELPVKEKIDNREFVQKEYLRLQSFLGKKIYYLEINSYPFDYPIYCDSKQEYDKLLREFNVEKKHHALTEMEEGWEEKAIPMGSFILTEEKMVEIVKRYATQPGIMPIGTRGIWSELLEEKE